MKLKNQEAKLKNFCRQTERRLDTTRTGVFATQSGAGFGRSTSAKAVWANKKALTAGKNSDIIKISGAVSGALNPESDRAKKHAAQYYEAVRHMTTDCKRIAENTGYPESEIKSIKDYIFMNKHDLGREQPEYFAPSYEMGQSWQRLIDGKNIQKHDLTMLKHEIMERDLIRQGFSQDEAHRKTSAVYDYSKESDDYYAEIEKHKTNG